MEKFDLNKAIKNIEDPETLQGIILALNDKIDKLESRITESITKENHDKNNDGGSVKTMILEKKYSRLEQIKHGINEITEQMEKPYVVSAELNAVKEVLDILAETGDCNSVILEGEPGTGKTQWAYSEVGQELSEGKDVSLIHVRIKDTMTAQDLLYTVDDVRRLSDAQTKAQMPEEIRNEALLWKEKIISGQIDPAKDEEYNKFKNKMNAISELGETVKDLDYLNYIDLGQIGEAIYQSGKGKKVYLLIDEIEKGREELMTGLLDEIEKYIFTITETGTIVKGDKKNLRIIITTNTEDSDKIPSSFRRRSLYHYMNYPGRADLAKIIELNLPGIREELMDYALNVFHKYNSHPDIEKKISTPELLAWIKVVSSKHENEIPEGVPYKETLLKYSEDRNLDIGMLNVEAKEEVEKSFEEELPFFVAKALKGEVVYSMREDINNYEQQEKYMKFYADLENRGMDFISPKFEKKLEYDEEYQENVNRYICNRNFQIVAPGAEYLGGTDYIFTEQQLKIFKNMIDLKTEVIEGNCEFKSVSEKNRKFTQGMVILDGKEYVAYRMNGDKRIVVKKEFNVK